MIAPGRVSLNVVSSWWKDEAAQYGAPFDVHDARYARTEEWLDGRRPAAARGHRRRTPGRCTSSTAPSSSPSPAGCRRSTWAASRRKAKEVIAAQADAYVMHGDAPEVIAAKVADLNERRGRRPAGRR